MMTWLWNLFLLLAVAPVPWPTRSVAQQVSANDSLSHAQEYGQAGPSARRASQDAASTEQLIRVSTDTLWLTEQYIEIDGSARLEREQLANLFSEGYGELFCSPDEPRFILIARGAAPVTEARPGIEPYRSRRYEEAIAGIVELLSEENDRSAAILADRNHMAEAKSLYRRLRVTPSIRSGQVRFGIVPASGDTAFCRDALKTSVWNLPEVRVHPPFVRFQTLAALQTTPVESWRLQIRDSAGKVVRTMSERGNFPPQMIWDWGSDALQLATPGHYSYTVDWTSPEGTVHTAVAGYISLIRKVRHVKLQFSRSFDLSSAQDGHIWVIVR
jgi:hypothetical protein